MADLSTKYLGLELVNPVIASACPLTGELASLRSLVDAGAAAVVLPSLFEEEFEREPAVAGGGPWHPGDSPGEAADYLEGLDGESRVAAYLDLVRDAKRELDVPVIASLNGTSPGMWTGCSELLQLAGADAVELNVYSVETDPYASSASVEDRLLRLVASVRTAISIPVAVKLGPYYTAFASVAHRLADEGAAGLVLFNRFLQPDIDLETFDVRPELHLSSAEELRVPLRWIAVLSGRVDVSLAATGGVASGEHAMKALLVGADVVMVASVLLREGPDAIARIVGELDSWLDKHGEPSVSAVHGRLSQIACGNPRAFERAQYVRAVSGRT